MSWSPKGLTDSLDGSTSFPGAMQKLQNVIPKPSTANLWEPRPAAQRKTNFTNAGAPANGGDISARLIVGDTEYGMIPSTRNPGFDEPYVFDLANDTFVTVSGITSANVPASLPSAGDWTPPIMSLIVPRVIVTHEGFSETNLFSTAPTGNTTGSPIITGAASLILGVLTGMSISGTGIPAGATAVSAEYFYLKTTGNTNSNTTLNNLASTTGVAVGQLVGGINITSGTTVAAIVSTSEVTLSIAATGTTAGGLVEFFGSEITMSAAATTTANNVALTITGMPILFGWFDISGFTLTTPGRTVSGSRIVQGAPQILGVQPGMTITGTEVGTGTLAIPAGTTVVQTAFVVRQVAATLTAGLKTVSGLDINGIVVGQDVAGAGIATGTTVAAVAIGSGTGSSVVLSMPAIATGLTTLTFSGATITLSAAAILTTFGSVNLAIAGGTRAAPRWGAGNTDQNPLPSKPVFVSRMAGRAWYAVGLDGIVFSDSGNPCRVSNLLGVQALTTGDGLAVTALGQQQLGTPLTGGVVQALIAFEGVNKMQQIIGDPATGNLAMNVISEATGTEAPLSIVPIGTGRLAFMSPLGIRLVSLDGSISDPIGIDGQGVTQPFQFATYPSRICAAFNIGVLRITVQNGFPGELPFEEYWYDVPRQIWHGPHSFPARLIQPWRSTFVVAPIAVSASLWQSDAFANNESDYIENGNRLSWIMHTVLLPDNAQAAMNAIVVSNIACVGSTTDPLYVTALDENGIVLDIVQIPATVGTRNLRQRPIDWTRPVIFKQFSIRVSGPSELGVRVGNHYALYEPLGYPMGDDDTIGFFLLSSRISTPILNADDGTHLFPG